MTTYVFIGVILVLCVVIAWQRLIIIPDLKTHNAIHWQEVKRLGILKKAIAEDLVNTSQKRWNDLIEIIEGGEKPSSQLFRELDNMLIVWALDSQTCGTHLVSLEALAFSHNIMNFKFERKVYKPGHFALLVKWDGLERSFYRELIINPLASPFSSMR